MIGTDSINLVLQSNAIKNLSVRSAKKKKNVVIGNENKKQAGTKC